MCEKEIKIVKEALKILKDRPSENKHLIANLAFRLDRYQKQLFHVMICGDVGTGKTSLVNALIGQPVLPVESTSAIFCISHGHIEKYIVSFASPDFSSAQRLEISKDELFEYGTKVGSKSKEVDHINIELPLPLLESGLVILDTPGLGSLFEGYSRMTWSYILPSADCGVFAFDSKRAVSENELDNIQRFFENALRVRNTDLPLGFIQTKIDEHNKEHWQDVRHQNCNKIESQLSLPKNKVLDCYFPVSSSAKEAAVGTDNALFLELSGLNLLTEYIQGINRNKNDMLARNLLVEAYEALTEHNRLIHIDIETERSFINRNQSDKYGKILKIEKATQEDLRNWENVKYPEIWDNFDFNFKCIWVQTGRKLTDEISTQLITPIIEKLDEIQLAPQTIKQETLIQKFSGAFKDMYPDFIRKCEKTISNLIDEFSKEEATLIKKLDSKIQNSFNEVIAPYLKAVAEVCEIPQHVNIPPLADKNRVFKLLEYRFKSEPPSLSTSLTTHEKIRLILGDSVLGSFASAGAITIGIVLKALVTGDVSLDPENVERVIEKVKEIVEEEGVIEKVKETVEKESDKISKVAVAGAGGAVVGFGSGVVQVKSQFKRKVLAEVETHLDIILREEKETVKRALNDYAETLRHDLIDRDRNELLQDLGKIWEGKVEKVKNLMESDVEKISEEILSLERQSEFAVKHMTKLGALLNAETE